MDASVIATTRHSLRALSAPDDVVDDFQGHVVVFHNANYHWPPVRFTQRHGASDVLRVSKPWLCLRLVCTVCRQHPQQQQAAKPGQASLVLHRTLLRWWRAPHPQTSAQGPLAPTAVPAPHHGPSTSSSTSTCTFAGASLSASLAWWEGMCYFRVVACRAVDDMCSVPKRSGKSSLLSSLLGQMVRTSGVVCMQGVYARPCVCGCLCFHELSAFLLLPQVVSRTPRSHRGSSTTHCATTCCSGCRTITPSLALRWLRVR